VIAVSSHAGTVETRVIDRGPGIPVTQWDTVFLPFQRLGDRDNGTGVGLGLALSRGLAEAMGGSLSPDSTPGGGLTMTLRLPQAVGAEGPAPDPDLDPALLAVLDERIERRHR
jgi:two-component system sensor histidine kinase KdpD